jgi:hypothetical protein
MWKPPFENKLEEEYWNQTNDSQKIAIRVAFQIIPNIYCIHRSQGFLSYLKNK